VLGTIYEFIAKYFNRDKTKIIPEILLVTIKSSGFSAVTAIALFNERAAIPSALLAIFVLIYLLFLSFRSELKIL
jgi:BASS family bile acid:Na+ symporter